MRSLVGAALVVATLSFASAASAATVFTGSGSVADVTDIVNSFRTSLGALNPNVAGSFGGGRREINWDGVPNALATPNNLPADFFNVTSPRGVVFSTPGTGFQVSANAGGATPTVFANIDPSYANTFAAFSSQRLFTARDSNIVDVNFFVPGGATPALVRGFGSVFSDVDLANTTSIQFFGAADVDLGTFFAPNLAGQQTFSFLGVDFGAPLITRVRITNGTTALGAGVTDGGGRDLVVMDDFIYGEPLAPTAAAVPEPSTWLVLIAGFGLAGGALRRQQRCQGSGAPQLLRKKL
jgi:hypothetical protein